MMRAISLSRPSLLSPLFQTLNSLLSLSCSGRILPAPPIRVPSAPYSSDSTAYEDVPGLESLPKLFVVQPRLRPDPILQAKLNEALCLANSLEEQRDGGFGVDYSDKDVPNHIVVQNPSAKGHKARADTYFGLGTVENVKIQLNLLESKGVVDAVFVNTILSGHQQRNLERAWGKPVLDRVALIIEIFNAHAYTKEAKLQAELAALMYKKSRLVRVRSDDGRYTFGFDGEAEVVSARGRGSGGRGFISGAGETELQLQRRRISERRKILLTQVEEVHRTRALQRASRKRRGGSHGQGLPTVAVVGYTNAGKSTLVSALSDSPLYSDDRLFATVDPTVRSAVLPSGRKVLLSDTVGFISNLPVQLVEAFHATLEEVAEADLLVHVLDCTAPNLEEHRSTVLSVLEQIGVSKEKVDDMIEVWNKIDNQEGGMDGDEYPDDAEDGQASEFSGEEEDDMASEQSLSAGNNQADSSDAYELSTDNVEAMDDAKDDYTDGCLASEDDRNPLSDEDGSFVPQKTTDAQQIQCSNESRHSQVDQSGPHVKTSALTGVGLQELLQIIDERLRDQDDKVKAKYVVERSAFGQKWRPPREEETAVAV
ncbi:GTP-binding protein At3g49725, chloroplastic [Morus notabilis]|uniref:GTP-binding protein At3g49725, chloroplastic n=1 Tax=Morus notabilis TaxID=981085 RepID=UPI000CECE799|nr:GTP-binding protein At3g49725, chloroplastic [Morus notabilis]